MQRYFSRVALVTTLLFQASAFAQLRPTYTPIAPNAPLEAALLQSTNRARQAEGLGTLRQDESLALAARHHAREMATLQYFSHESPNALNRTPSARVARAGSAVVTVGENLASVPNRDVAVVTTQGWLDSPGHRANLLNERFTHVGFGTATDAQGQVIVVQVLAYEPLTLLDSTVTSSQQQHYAIRLDVALDEPGEAVFNYGGENSQPIQLEAGRHTVNLQTEARGEIQLRGALRAPTGGGFIVEDAGWLTLPSGRYRSDDSAPKNTLKILNATANLQTTSVYDVRFSLEGETEDLAVFVDGVYQPEAVAAPGQIALQIPSSTVRPEIQVGIADEGSRVAIVLSLTIDTSFGKPMLTAQAPE